MASRAQCLEVQNDSEWSHSPQTLQCPGHRKWPLFTRPVAVCRSSFWLHRMQETDSQNQSICLCPGVLAAALTTTALFWISTYRWVHPRLGFSPSSPSFSSSAWLISSLPWGSHGTSCYDHKEISEVPRQKLNGMEKKKNPACVMTNRDISPQNRSRRSLTAHLIWYKLTGSEMRCLAQVTNGPIKRKAKPPDSVIFISSHDPPHRWLESFLVLSCLEWASMPFMNCKGIPKKFL